MMTPDRPITQMTNVGLHGKYGNVGGSRARAKGSRVLLTLHTVFKWIIQATTAPRFQSMLSM